MEKHITYFNLLGAFKEKGCPVCFLIEKWVNRAMNNFLYENVNNPELRITIRESLGYCSFHSWELQRLGDGLGLSIIYQDLLRLLNDKIEKFINSGVKNRLLLKELLQDNNRLDYHEKIRLNCPICKIMKDAERIYILSFIDYFDDEEFKINFKSSFGLCLPHLILTLKLCNNKDTLKELFTLEMEKIKSLREELHKFQDKQAYKFSNENYGNEIDSWIRAIEKLIGKKGIC